MKVEGRVCANSNCHHTESQHGDGRSMPSLCLMDCSCNGFVARRDTTRVPEPAKPLDGDFNSLHHESAAQVADQACDEMIENLRHNVGKQKTVEVKAGSANAVQADDRVATALERIATALESIDQKLPWLGQLTATVWPSPPWNPIPQTMCQSPS